MIYGLYARNQGSVIFRSMAARYLVNQHHCYGIQLDDMLTELRDVYTRYTDIDTDREKWNEMMLRSHKDYRIPILTRMLHIVDKYPIKRPIVITDLDSQEEVVYAQSRGTKIIHLMDGGGIDTIGCDHSIGALNIEELYDRLDKLMKKE